MSNSERTLRFKSVVSGPRSTKVWPLRVIATEREHDNAPLSVDTLITIRDGWDVEQGQGEGTFEVALPEGLYTVRFERAGAVSERVVRHAGPTSIQNVEPKRTSALPSFDTADSHEYYAYTAAELSRLDTNTRGAALASAAVRPPTGRLFLFVRAAEMGSHDGRGLTPELSLTTPNGDLLTKFRAEDIEQDFKHGWAAFSAPATAGSYVLRCSGLVPRDMAIDVFEGWETQVFVPFEHRPRLERASVLMARNEDGFRPDDRLAQAVDAGLAGLQAGVDLMPREARRMLLDGKFENPMLGLIGAHILLLAKEPGWGLVDIVIDNLERLVPASSDLRAIRLAAASVRGHDIAGPPVTTMPMLSRSTAAVIAASAVQPELVPAGGVIDGIAPYLLSDSPWTTWSGAGYTRTVVSVGLKTRVELSTSDPTADLPPWVRALLEGVRKRGAGSEGLAALARQSNLPLGLLQRALSELNRSSGSEFSTEGGQ